MTTRRKPPATVARVHLLPVQAMHQPVFLAAVRASRALHRPWVSPPATPEQFTAYAERMQTPSYCGLLIARQGEAGALELAGVVNITNMVMGPFCSAYLGYYAFAGFERQGLMREGLTQAVRLAFRKLKLHRLEANIQPGNAASLALVRSCGFTQEGYSPKYLKSAAAGATTSAGPLWRGRRAPSANSSIRPLAIAAIARPACKRSAPRG